MGLDTVELVMEIEDAFSIKIPNYEATRLVTADDVFDYIVAKTNVPTNSSICLSAIAFYSIRGAATSLGATKRLRPSDSTSAMLPDTNRPRYWSQLQSTSKLMLPPLQRPAWLVTTCTVMVLICSVVFGFLVYRSTNSQPGGVAAAIFMGIELGLVFGVLTRPFAVFPDSNCTTLRGLAESALGMNFKTLSERYNGANKNNLWIALRSIIVEQLDLSPEEVKSTASFVNDLGCD